MWQGILRKLSARQWLIALLAGVLCLASWQVWLTLRLLDQERNLELQRSRERLGEIADVAVVQLARNFGDWDLALRELNTLPPPSALLPRFPENATFILISREGINIAPKRPLLFTPVVPMAENITDSYFKTADQLELRDRQYDRALAALRPLEHNPETRAQALLRTARIEYKAHRPEAALLAYQSLATESAINSSGTPYALLATKARCRILSELNRHDQASQEAESLRSKLLDGRWPLSREAFEFNWSELNSLGLQVNSPPKASLDFSTLVEDLYSKWQTSPTRGASIRGRELQKDSSLLIWNLSSGRLGAVLTQPDWLGTALKLPANSHDVQWRFLSSGQAGDSGFTVMRSMAEVQIPGRLEFLNAQPISGAASNRQTLLIVGAALMLLVILSSGYVVYRAISRELSVAQLQSDFVSAVSHEFRSPLTTLRTLTELLAQNRISDEPRRQKSYVFLERETARLHRLVEDLLDFGRMESGRKQYRLEPHDAYQLVRATIDDFNEHAQAQGFSVESDLAPSEMKFTAPVKVDEEAFRRAVRNLLENAVKYSPVCRTVWVSAAVSDSKVWISVRDRGMGIDAHEEQAIFQRFVRGQAAKNAGIKGTGIGLAMVRQISEAMGGEIRVQSEVGIGSTFTLVLPLAED